METILSDLRHAIRGITNRPGGAALAVFTLALGIGATTALYSVVHGVLLRPLGFAEEERLYAVLSDRGLGGADRPGNSLPDFWFLRDHQRSFADLTFYTWHSMTLEEPGHLGQLRGLFVDENIFRVLGLEPLLGRSFTAADVVPGLENRRLYFERLLDKFAEVPGIDAVSLSTAAPVPDLGISIDVPCGTDDPPLALSMASEGGAPQAAFRVVSPGYLETVGIPLVRGRDFTDRDTEEAPQVVMLNQTLAHRLWGDDNPIGQRLEIFFGENLNYEVVGVVGDTRFAGRDVPPRPALFVAYPQMPFMGIAVIARSKLAPAVYEEALRRTVLEIDPLQPINGVWSLERHLARSLGTERFFAAVLGLFAVLALILAAAGIYAVFSYWVSQRTREIGLRMALGARMGQVAGMVVGEGLRVTAVGLVFGLAGAVLTANLLARSFRGVTTLPVGLITIVAALLAGVALLACYLPARRASHIQPSVALRGD